MCNACFTCQQIYAAASLSLHPPSWGRCNLCKKLSEVMLGISLTRREKAGLGLSLAAPSGLAWLRTEVNLSYLLLSEGELLAKRPRGSVQTGLPLSDDVRACCANCATESARGRAARVPPGTKRAIGPCDDAWDGFRAE